MSPLDRWKAVMAIRVLTGPQKAVMNCLAYHANETTLEAWPALETISSETGFGRTAVRNAIQALLSSGALSSVEKSEGRRSNRYRVNLDEPTASRTVQPLNDSSREQFNLPPGEREPAASRTSTCRLANPNKERTGKGTRNKSQQPEKRFTQVDRAVADEIFAKMQILHPGHKPPNFDAWADEIRLMRERDGRTVAEIRELFAWANADSFWKANILSPAKLRQKWDTLTIKKNARLPPRSPSDLVLESPI